MSTTIQTGTHKVTFASPEDKKRTFSHLIDSNAPFRGVGVDTLIIQNTDYETLKNKGVKFA